MTSSAAPQAQPAPPAAQASPESLDQVITTTRSRGWLALGATAAAIIIAILWACLAEIPQQNSATGVVSALHYSSDVSAPTSGILRLTTVRSPDSQSTTRLGDIEPFDGSGAVPVTIPDGSEISAVYAVDGQGVVEGEVLATATTPPDSKDGIVVATFVPADEALTYFPDQRVQVTVTDLQSSRTVVVDGVVEHVSDTPSSMEAMVTMSGSTSLAQEWSEGSDGMPFRILMRLEDWPAADVSTTPASGQLVAIVHTYGKIRPIQLLFGGK